MSKHSEDTAEEMDSYSSYSNNQTEESLLMDRSETTMLTEESMTMPKVSPIRFETSKVNHNSPIIKDQSGKKFAFDAVQMI